MFEKATPSELRKTKVRSSLFQQRSRRSICRADYLLKEDIHPCMIFIPISIPTDVLNWLKENKNTVNAEWIKKEKNKEEFLIVNQKWGFELKKSFIDFELYTARPRKGWGYTLDDFSYPTAFFV